MLDATDMNHAGLVQDWLDEFEAALAGGPEALRGLFLEDCHWRDVLAGDWQIRTFSGVSAVTTALAACLAETRPAAFAQPSDRVAAGPVSRAGEDVLEAIFIFTSARGSCEGVLRLKPAADGTMKAWTLLTALNQISGHEEPLNETRPTGASNARDFRGPNWLDQRRDSAAFADRNPNVLVVGCGQAGLAIAARLVQFGVDTLVVDRHERIGDNWRKRYHALTLHNKTQANHLPYMPFPPNWPAYIPKDKLANWFEAYAEAMELNIWTETAFEGGTYDDAAGRWNATVVKNGYSRLLKPRHVVMATGVSGIPFCPDMVGLDVFKGPVLHASEYTDGEDWRGKRAIVFGTGNSGHDIAQDLWSAGARVTMVQRRPTLVVQVEPSAQLPYALYWSGLPLEDCDLITISMPLPLQRRTHQLLTEDARRQDKPLLDRLEAAGFRLDFGEDDTGWQMKYLTRGGGYYFNVGCSDLIADGSIALVQNDDVRGFTPDGIRLNDGRTVDADLVVLATGYHGQDVLIRRLFGDVVADRVGPIWGFGDEQELRNMFVRTRQQGLWFIAGSLAQCRIYSKYLALQIKACELGLMAP